MRWGKKTKEREGRIIGYVGERERGGEVEVMAFMGRRKDTGMDREGRGRGLW